MPKKKKKNEEEENYYKTVRIHIFGVTIILLLILILFYCNGDRNKTLTVEKYLNKIRSHLKDIINNTNNFTSSIHNDKKCVMHSKSDNIEIMINDEANEVTKELLIHLKIDIKIIWNQ